MENRFKDFTVLVNNIQYYINKIKNGQMSKLGLKGTHVTCLYYLYSEKGGLTAKALCDICGEDKAAISRSVEFLEANGYITCQSKTVKRYNSTLTLTDKGIETAKWVEEKINGVLDTAGCGLTGDERKALYKSLKLVRDNLEIICRNMED